MTVKLLVAYKYGGINYAVGNLLTADAGTETGLTAAKLADSNLAGGTAYVAPIAPESVDETRIAAYSFDSAGNVSGLVGPGGNVSLASNFGPVVAWLGDSIFEGGDVYVGGVIPRRTNYSVASWANILSSQRFTTRFSDNYAVGGYTTADVIANKLASCVAAAPRAVVVLIGTNDVASGVSLETIKANLTTIYSTLVKAGITVIACPILPRSYINSGGTISVAMRQSIANINQWIKNYALVNKCVYIADAWPTLADMSTGTVLGGGVLGTPPAATGYTYDGLHPAARGAYWVGKAISDVINQLLPPVNTLRWSMDDTYHATNNPQGDWLTNGFISTTSGGTAGAGVTGTVAGSWTVQRSGGTTGAAVASITTKALANGQTYNAQRLVITAPAGSSTEMIWMYQQVFVAGSIGKNVIAEVEISVSALGAANAIKSVYIECSDSVTTCADQFPSVAFLMPDVAWSGVLKTQPFLCTANVQQINIRIQIDGTVASAGLTVDVSRLAFRAV